MTVKVTRDGDVVRIVLGVPWYARLAALLPLAGAWQRNNGIRIDHLLLSPQAADLLRDAGVDKQMRALEKASDHTPAWIELQVA